MTIDLIFDYINNAKKQPTPVGAITSNQTSGGRSVGLSFCGPQRSPGAKQGGKEGYRRSKRFSKYRLPPAHALLPVRRTLKLCLLCMMQM